MSEITKRRGNNARNPVAKQNNAARKIMRRETAEKRNTAWRALCVEDQIAVLLTRPGKCSKQLAYLYS